MEKLDDLYQKANEALQRGEKERAIELYSLVVERYPDSEEANYAQVNIDNIVGQREEKKEPVKLIGGFWRRIFSFLIDVLVLGVLGVALGTMFFDYFAGLGGWGRLIGFTIALGYFGSLNSSMANGQTLGKRLLKLRVVDTDGETISLPRSAMRFSILGIPYFLNGAPISINVMSNMFLTTVLGIAIFFLGGSIVYLYVFNRITRQSLHDLAIGTYVINVSREKKEEFPLIWRGHLTVVGCIFVAVLFLVTTIIPRLGEKELFAEMIPVLTEMQNSGLVHTVSVSSGRSTFSSVGGEKQVTTYFSVKAILNKRPDDYDIPIRELAKLSIEKYRPINEKDMLVIFASYGFDIGIARAAITRNRKHTPDEWRNILSGKDSTEI